MPLDECVHTAADLHIDGILEMLGVDASHPLELLVPNDASRRWATSLQTNVVSAPLPPNAFLELKPGKSARDQIALPKETLILCESPALAIVRGARHLQQLVR